MKRSLLSASLVWAAFAAAIFASGCGNKTRPVPPSQAIPIAIADLHADSEHDGIRLTFSRPTTYMGGNQMRDLNHFVIMRAEDDGPLQPLVEAPAPDRERLQQPKTLSYLDKDTVLNRSYRYAIVSVTDDGDASAPSNVAHAVRRPMPPPASLGAPAKGPNDKHQTAAPTPASSP